MHAQAIEAQLGPLAVEFAKKLAASRQSAFRCTNPGGTHGGFKQAVKARRENSDPGVWGSTETLHTWDNAPKELVAYVNFVKVVSLT